MDTNETHYKQVKALTGFNTRVLNFKYLSATNHKGSRVKITDPRFKKSVTIGFNSIYDNCGEVAVEYLLKNGWAVSGINEDAGVVILSDWNPDQQL